jgi:type II secretory pathway pseudopilin PulG
MAMSCKRETGFSLLETMVALGVLSVVGAIVMTGMVQMMKTQGTIANRTEMHTSVRSATELLEQEIGQAGRLTLGSPNGGVTLANAVAGTANFTLNSPSGSACSPQSSCPAPTLYQNEVLTVDTGGTDSFGNSLEETVTLSAGAANTGTATFVSPHASGAPVTALGAFATGVVPPDGTTLGSDPNGQCAPTSVTVGGLAQNYVAFANGSTCENLKLYGDINGDGNLVYVRYDCVQGTQAAPGFLYRQQLSYQDFVNGKTITEPPPASAILLSNVLTNPPDVNNAAVPCFRYQVQPLGTGWLVTDVAVTLTVQTQNNDPVTHQPQKETKALLNVSPRNIYEVWTTASQNMTDVTRAQAMPSWISGLL